MASYVSGNMFERSDIRGKRNRGRPKNTHIRDNYFVKRFSLSLWIVRPLLVGGTSRHRNAIVIQSSVVVCAMHFYRIMHTVTETDGCFYTELNKSAKELWTSIIISRRSTSLRTLLIMMMMMMVNNIDKRNIQYKRISFRINNTEE